MSRTSTIRRSLPPHSHGLLLWPPNHGPCQRRHTGVSHPNNNATITITGVNQDEPASGLGDGDTPVDADINADGTALLRAERSGTGDGAYIASPSPPRILREAARGGVVKVPHSVKKPAIDSGDTFPSTE